jgi:CheY-like chemotaxis protein
MSGLRVLIVDDEFLILDYICDVVRSGGHDVVGTAGDGPSALALIAEHRPDVAVLDIQLKGDLDGVALAEAIRRGSPGVGRIFISGSGDPDTLARAQATEPIAFLQKPFSAAKLLDALSALSATRAAEAAG